MPLLAGVAAGEVVRSEVDRLDIEAFGAAIFHVSVGEGSARVPLCK